MSIYGNNCLITSILLPPLEAFLPLHREIGRLEKPVLRIGFSELHYGAHFDLQTNYFAQVAGEKRVLLWNPAEHAAMDWVSNPEHPHYRQSRFWPRDSLHGNGTSRLRELRDSQALQAVLLPGDMLIIPALWFHYLEALLP